MSTLRIGGFYSGFDTDQIVKDLMRVHQLKKDQLLQQKQTLSWRKDQYRETINQIRRFKDEFFNQARPETSLLSASTLKQMTAASSHAEVTVGATSGALSGTTTLKVIQSATAAKATAAAVCQDSAAGTRLNLTDSMDVVNSKLTEQIQFDAEGKLNFTINGVDISISNSDSLESVIYKINSSSAQVQLHYSSFSDTLTMTAKNTGSGTIQTDNNGAVFSALGFDINAGSIGTVGRDAQFEINGFAGTSSSNAFNIDGISYKINTTINEPLDGIVITTGLHTDKIYGVIEKFVSDYNALLDNINGELNEEQFRSFDPLTDEQKQTMTEKDIEIWEKRAQSGLLKGESSLSLMLRDMRQALYDMVGEFQLAQIGIDTSSNYRDQGKLVLKNSGSTLREAIVANPDKVAELFSRSSSIAYSPDLTASERAQRYQEAGLAHRLSDILNNSIRTTRDSQGRKGVLLEKAGIVGDVTEFKNTIEAQIANLNKRIDQMDSLLLRKEEQYYKQFTAMEKALQKMQAQGDWLTMQLGQSS